jgi:hypothetical protein
MALGSLEASRIGMLGLAFKPGIDDVRDAPALDLAARLLDCGATVTVFDPVVSSVSLPGLTIVADPHDVAGGADAIVVATEWPDFRRLALGRPSIDAARRPNRWDDVDVAVSRISDKQLRPGAALVSAHQTNRHCTSDSTERESATWKRS